MKKLLQRVREFLFGIEPPEQIPGSVMGQPKDYPDGPPQNHTEHCDKVGVQPGGRIQ